MFVNSTSEVKIVALQTILNQESVELTLDKYMDAAREYLLKENLVGLRVVGAFPIKAEKVSIAKSELKKLAEDTIGDAATHYKGVYPAFDIYRRFEQAKNAAVDSIDLLIETKTSAEIKYHTQARIGMVRAGIIGFIGLSISYLAFNYANITPKTFETIFNCSATALTLGIGWHLWKHEGAAKECREEIYLALTAVKKEMREAYRNLV